MKKITSLNNWIRKWFGDRVASSELKHQVNATLTAAGFKDGVSKDNHGLASKIANKVVKGHNNLRVSNTRYAAVVSADGNCPRCGSPMQDVLLGENQPARYCTNPTCRVTAHIG